MGRRLALPGPMGHGAFTYSIQLLECSEGIWATWRAFLLHQQGASGSHEGSAGQAFVSAETLKACALIGLHLLEPEDEASSGSQSPDLGDMWRYGCPRSPDGDSDVESWTESEGTSLTEQCEHNVEGTALNAMGQDQVKNLSLPGRLKTCEGDFDLPHFPGDVPGNA